MRKITKKIVKKIPPPQIRRANKSEAAEFFDISLPTLDRWIREGMPIFQRGTRGVSWIIDLMVVAKWKYSPMDTAGPLDPETLVPSERKIWYDGETSRRKLQERDRELIPQSEVEECVGTSFAAVAQALLSLSDTLERKVGLTRDQSQLSEEIVHSTLTTLKENLSTIRPLEK
jgi:hypothetical protein